MIHLFTDFGSRDIYIGQVKTVLRRHAPEVEVLDICNDLADYDIANNAHLLAALADCLVDPQPVVLAVVDPGVGGERRPLAVQADGRWLVGPDNGLLSVVIQRARACQCWEILWRPAAMSRSFHGRDLFAPVAAMLATGTLPDDALQPATCYEACDDGSDRCRVIYVDHYGNAITGIRATPGMAGCLIEINGSQLRQAGTFGDASPGEAFWYVNSLGLLEIAINQGNAAAQLSLRAGMPVTLR